MVVLGKRREGAGKAVEFMPCLPSAAQVRSRDVSLESLRGIDRLLQNRREGSAHRSRGT